MALFGWAVQEAINDTLCPIDARDDLKAYALSGWTTLLWPHGLEERCHVTISWLMLHIVLQRAGLLLADEPSRDIKGFADWGRIC